MDGNNYMIVYTENEVMLARSETLYFDGFTSTANPSTVGQTITLTATWSGSGPVPTGTITFMDGTTVLGTVTLVNGVGTLTLSNLPQGSRTITTEYSGDATYNGAVSTSFVQVVNAVQTLANTGVNVPVAASTAVLAISIFGILKLRTYKSKK